jgi:hypothetical protein
MLQYAIEYLSSELPPHRLRITGAAELQQLPTINRDNAGESYEFEVKMSGYYSDPLPDPALRRGARAGMIHTNDQTVFARTSENLLKAVLGSPKTRPGTKFFIEGEYTFSYGPQENGSYIELTHISFNSTHRTETSTTSANPPIGDSARRRNVKPKNKGSTPQKPVSGPHSFPQQSQSPTTQDVQNQHSVGSVPTSSQQQSHPITPHAGTSIHATPSTKESAKAGLSTPLALAYQLDDFVNIDDLPCSPASPQETISPSEVAKGKRRAHGNVDTEPSATRPKRNRKPTAKATALRFFDLEAGDGAEEEEIEISDNEEEEYL